MYLKASGVKETLSKEHFLIPSHNPHNSFLCFLFQMVIFFWKTPILPQPQPQLLVKIQDTQLN